MTIGASLLLIAVGAILRFAVQTVSTHGIDLHVIGDILMIIGVVGLLLWLVLWGPWARSRRGGLPQRPPRDAEEPPGAYEYHERREYPADYTGEYPTQEYPPGDPRYPSGRRGRP